MRLTPGMRRQDVPEKYQRLLIVAGLGSVIGAAAGVLLWGTILAVALCVVLGYVFGGLVAVLGVKKVSTPFLSTLEHRVNVILGIASAVLAGAGTVAFLWSWRIEMILSALFFAVCAAYLLISSRAE